MTETSLEEGEKKEQISWSVPVFNRKLKVDYFSHNSRLSASVSTEQFVPHSVLDQKLVISGTLL